MTNEATGPNHMNSWNIKRFLLQTRWPWHLIFWVGYVLFRFYVYFLTVKYYPSIFLHYMLLAEVMVVGMVYFTLWLYRRMFEKEKYLAYFIAGVVAWLSYLYGKTMFQFYYLKNEPNFQNNKFWDIIINNITFVIVFFLFITACKYFKDGFIRQQFEAERKQQQIVAEINNLKSQIAPHFLFNTLNNLYGLAVDKSDKLPGLMLQLSDLLRHSLYETQKPLVSVTREIDVLKSYIELESVRLEEDLQLTFDNGVPVNAPYDIAPLILIVFVENAFKHAKFVRVGPVHIDIKTRLEDGWFTLTTKNNYNTGRQSSTNGIGLTNVKRRLEVLYPEPAHELMITKDETYYIVTLRLQLEKSSLTESVNESW